MNVAKWLLLTLLALPFLELAVFLTVAGSIGFLWAMALLLATSVGGAMLLRHAGGNHIARIRVAMGNGSFTALQADSAGGATLLAGILLFIPGFITDILGLLLLLAPLRRALAARLGVRPQPARADGVVDLEPEQWRQVPDAALTDRRDKERKSP
ncbi:MAG: FxsA family protein [Pseudolabrys sp.]